jgi:hypothetical protein
MTVDILLQNQPMTVKGINMRESLYLYKSFVIGTE